MISYRSRSSICRAVTKQPHEGSFGVASIAHSQWHGATTVSAVHEQFPSARVLSHIETMCSVSEPQLMFAWQSSAFRSNLIIWTHPCGTNWSLQTRKISSTAISASAYSNILEVDILGSLHRNCSLLPSSRLPACISIRDIRFMMVHFGGSLYRKLYGWGIFSREKRRQICGVALARLKQFQKRLLHLLEKQHGPSHID